MSTRWTVALDSPEPAALAAFWRLALGYVQASPPEGFATSPMGSRTRADRRRSGMTEPSSKILKEHVLASRLFESQTPRWPRIVSTWMCRPVGVAASPRALRWPRVTQAVERLTAAGATVIREDVQNGTPDHVVMADPEGNEFSL